MTVTESNSPTWTRFRDACGKLLAHALVIGLVVGVIVALSNAYFAVGAANRTAIESDYTLFKASSNDLSIALAKYAAQAKTGAPVDEDSAKKFQSALLSLRNSADAIATRDNHLRHPFDDLTKSILQLKRTADELKGPLNAKPFVEATSAYLAGC